jgi:hypothetical protein
LQLRTQMERELISRAICWSDRAAASCAFMMRHAATAARIITAVLTSTERIGRRKNTLVSAIPNDILTPGGEVVESQQAMNIGESRQVARVIETRDTLRARQLHTRDRAGSPSAACVAWDERGTGRREVPLRFLLPQ